MEAALQFEPVTLSDLVASGAELTVHCRACGHWGVIDPALLPATIRNRPVPALEGRFRCSHCNGRNTCAMPLYPAQKRASRATGKGWIDPPGE